MNVEPRLLRIADVINRVSLSKGSIAKLEKAGKFPKRIKLGGCRPLENQRHRRVAEIAMSQYPGSLGIDFMAVR